MKIETLKKHCNSANFTFIDYNVDTDTLYYVCNRHKNKGVQNMSSRSIYHTINTGKCGCKYKSYDKMDLINSGRINENVEIIGECSGYHTPILCKCKICEKEFNMTPNFLRRGHACKYCFGKYKRLTQDEFQRRVSEIHPNIKILSLYQDHNTKVDCKCTLCGKQFKRLPYNLMTPKLSKSCPQCGMSNGEKKIFDVLTEMNIDFTMQQKFYGCKNQRYLLFDFYLPEYNIAIEYQGEGHFRPLRVNGDTQKSLNVQKSNENFQKQQYRDNIKRKYCKSHKIHLIEINYSDFDKIYYILSELLL